MNGKIPALHAYIESGNALVSSAICHMSHKSGTEDTWARKN